MAEKKSTGDCPFGIWIEKCWACPCKNPVEQSDNPDQGKQGQKKDEKKENAGNLRNKRLLLILCKNLMLYRFPSSTIIKLKKY